MNPSVGRALLLLLQNLQTTAISVFRLAHECWIALQKVTQKMIRLKKLGRVGCRTCSEPFPKGNGLAEVVCYIRLPAGRAVKIIRQPVVTGPTFVLIARVVRKFNRQALEYF